jgi:hypothetical protein
MTQDISVSLSQVEVTEDGSHPGEIPSDPSTTTMRSSMQSAYPSSIREDRSEILSPGIVPEANS